MKVSSRGGACRGARLGVPALPGRPLRPAGGTAELAACGPSAAGRCAVARPPRRLRPSAAGSPGRPGGGRRGAAARPGPAAWAPGKFPHYRCQLARH